MDITKNVSTNEHCRSCCDSPGWVFVGWSGDGTEQMAPCPFCELGKSLEYGPLGSKRWPDGFWQGQSPSGLSSPCRCDAKPVSRREALGALRSAVLELGLKTP